MATISGAVSGSVKRPASAPPPVVSTTMLQGHRDVNRGLLAVESSPNLTAGTRDLLLLAGQDGVLRACAEAVLLCVLSLSDRSGTCGTDTAGVGCCPCLPAHCSQLVSRVEGAANQAGLTQANDGVVQGIKSEVCTTGGLRIQQDSLRRRECNAVL